MCRGQLVFDTFVPVFLQAGHPLWHNTTGLHSPPVGVALVPSRAFFIMTWDNLIHLFAGMIGMREPYRVTITTG